LRIESEQNDGIDPSNTGAAINSHERRERGLTDGQCIARRSCGLQTRPGAIDSGG
jgi:hypothetical protein